MFRRFRRIPIQLHSNFKFSAQPNRKSCSAEAPTKPQRPMTDDRNEMKDRHQDRFRHSPLPAESGHHQDRHRAEGRKCRCSRKHRGHDDDDRIHTRRIMKRKSAEHRALKLKFDSALRSPRRHQHNNRSSFTTINLHKINLIFKRMNSARRPSTLCGTLTWTTPRIMRHNAEGLADLGTGLVDARIEG